MNPFWIGALTAALWMAMPVLAQEKSKSADKSHSAAEVQKDVQDHLAMADAHTAAAKCLQSGKPVKECHAQLAKDCKGLGIGSLCGMKHKH
jgi:hypothetical protein